MTPGGGGYGQVLDPSTDGSSEPPRKRLRKSDPVATHHYQQKGSVYAYTLARESA